MQRYGYAISVFLIFVGAVGTKWELIWAYVFGGASQMIRDAIDFVQSFDFWLVERGAFPSLIAIGVIGVAVSYFAPQIWAHLRRYPTNKAVFEKEFNLIEYQKARQNFAWALQHAFNNYRCKPQGSNLEKLLTNLQFPGDFPPPQDKKLSEYAQPVVWPTEAGEVLWPFFKKLFEEMSALKCDLISEPGRYEAFVDGRRISSKFWDDWARAIRQRRLRYDDVKTPFEANKQAIRALAVSELAMATVFSLDPGGGKRSLFLLAIGPERLLAD